MSAFMLFLLSVSQSYDMGRWRWVAGQVDGMDGCMFSCTHEMRGVDRNINSAMDGAPCQPPTCGSMVWPCFFYGYFLPASLLRAFLPACVHSLSVVVRTDSVCVIVHICVNWTYPSVCSCRLSISPCVDSVQRPSVSCVCATCRRPSIHPSIPAVQNDPTQHTEQPAIPHPTPHTHGCYVLVPLASIAHHLLSS